MKSKLIAVALLLVSFSFGYAFNANAPPDDQTLKQLHQQRIETLTKIRDGYLALEAKGFRKETEYSTAMIRLEQARFDAAENDQQRLAALQGIVNVHQKLVKEQNTLRDKGLVPSSNLWSYEADLLAAQIKLEELKLTMQGK